MTTVEGSKSITSDGEGYCDLALGIRLCSVREIVMRGKREGVKVARGDNYRLRGERRIWRNVIKEREGETNKGKVSKRCENLYK